MPIILLKFIPDIEFDMLRILIADDHSIVRLGTSLLLKDEFGNVEISEAGNFDQVIALLSDHQFDLILLDINMPGGDNLDMIPSIHLRDKNVKILVFSSYDESVFAMRYIQAGASGYLGKDTEEEVVIHAVKTILKGDKYISEKLVQHQLSNFSNNKSEIATLSDREWEILNLLVKGNSTSEIANTLNLRLNTISTYKVRIFQKMNVSNIVELIEKVKLNKMI